MTTAIQTTDLTKMFGAKTAVRALNLSVRQGELFGLLGLNGAGKTTTIRMLTCLIRPTSGDALVLGDSIVASASSVKEHINVSPQETAIARNLSTRENLEMIAGIYGCERDLARERAGDMLSAFGLEGVADEKARKLSGGMQRRLSIAMALISKPSVLFLDEPTLGLDVLARRGLWTAIQELKGRVTVVLTTHSMQEAEALADRIGIMVEGELRAVGTPTDLLTATGSQTLEDAFVALATAHEVCA